jgi:hypothetical protein
MKFPCLLLLLCMLAFAASAIMADVPMCLNYQGRLTDDGGDPLTGDYWIEFSIWDDPDAGTMKWHSNPRSMIHVEDGLFTYELGSNYPLPQDIFLDTSNWLQIVVQGEAITPRTRLNTTPYAYHSHTSDDDGDWSESSGDLYRTDGYVGIGMDNPATKLEVAGVMRILRDDDYVPPGNGEGMEIYYDPVEGVGVIDVFERPMGYRKFNFEHSPVGIGVMNAQERLDVAGAVQASDFIVSKDERFTTNVQKLENVLERLDEIDAVLFEESELYESLGRATGNTQIGVIAQDVEKAFPELVTTWEDGGYKSVSYVQLTAVLLGAVKELKQENEELKNRINILEQQMNER